MATAVRKMKKTKQKTKKNPDSALTVRVMLVRAVFAERDPLQPQSSLGCSAAADQRASFTASQLEAEALAALW